MADVEAHWHDLVALYLVTVETDPHPWTLGLEVRLDDPAHHILHGGDGLVAHSDTTADEAYEHLDDPDWAVFRIDAEPVASWNLEQRVARARAWLRSNAT